MHLVPRSFWVILFQTQNLFIGRLTNTGLAQSPDDCLSQLISILVVLFLLFVRSLFHLLTKLSTQKYAENEVKNAHEDLANYTSDVSVIYKF